MTSGLLLVLAIAAIFIVVSLVIVYEGMERARRWRFKMSWTTLSIGLVLVSIVLGFIFSITGLGAALIAMGIASMPLVRLSALLKKKTDTNFDMEYAYGIVLLNMAPICVIVFIVAGLFAVFSVCNHFNLIM